MSGSTNRVWLWIAAIALAFIAVQFVSIVVPVNSGTALACCKDGGREK